MKLFCDYLRVILPVAVGLLIRILCREHQYCSGRPLSQLDADLETRRIGKHQVQNHELRLFGGSQIETLGATGSLDDVRKIIGERVSSHSPNLILIVYYERRALRHGSTIAPLG